MEWKVECKRQHEMGQISDLNIYILFTWSKAGKSRKTFVGLRSNQITIVDCYS